MTRWLLILLLAIAGGCAAVPRPRVLSDVEAVEKSPAAAESKRLAPQAYAHADLLRRRADQAHESGDRARAQALGEHALAAFTHAFVLARLAKAEQELARSRQALAKAETELARLDEQQKRIAVEVDDLELRVKVARDAIPLLPNSPASPERETARREAALALSGQARLLCLAARLLDGKLEGLESAASKVDALEQKLSAPTAPVPIDDAIVARSSCLKLLTHARRPARRNAPASGQEDALFAELAQLGDLMPYRDDRGIVVTLRGLFGRAEALSKQGTEQLTLLARVAKAHPDFPVLVVVHASQGSPSGRDTKRADAIAELLRGAGAPKVEARAAGGGQPIANPGRPGAPARNERIEIVFVSPA
jgi:outer membrane protein OmpA-like peptidoglycan-associated protein